VSARPIRADELLDLARSFVPPNAPPGRPRSAHLRRAVSLAYYALFHELAELATVELCGAGLPQAARRWQASRWFAHTDVKTLAEAVTGAGGGAGRAVATVLDQPHPDLVAVARQFRNLQAARYGADYQHDYDLPPAKAVTLVDSAAEAISLARRLRRDGDRSFQMFLKLMVGAVKIARTRAR
jgi:hypothetical protein